MAPRILLGMLLPLALFGCSTPEEQFASDSQKLLAGGERNFPHMCGTIAEILFERSERFRLDGVQARIASGAVVDETDDYVDVESRVRATATGYRSSGIDVDCRFAQEPANAGIWHNLLAMKIAGRPLGDDEIANVNALGASLDGFGGTGAE